MINVSKKCKTHPFLLTNTRQEIKSLNKDIKSYFNQIKSKNVRRGIKPGNSKTLWEALKKAKECNIEMLPDTLFYRNTKINNKDKATTFTNFFPNKVNSIV